MKRTMFIISIIGLFLVSTMDLQARHTRRSLPRIVRAGIAIATLGHIAAQSHRDSYDRNQYRGGYNRNQYRGGYDRNQYRGGYNQNQYRGGYDRNQYRDGHQVAREMRRNEERIWKLENRISRLERHYDNQWEIQRLEQEIYSLQRRNDYLRGQLY